MRTTPITLAALSCLALGSVAHATTYSLTPLGDLPGGGTASWGAALNDIGDATGESLSAAATTYSEGFFYAGGPLQGVGSLQASPFWSKPQAINNLQQVTGWSLTNAGWQAFLFEPGSGIVGLGYAGGCVGGEGGLQQTSYGWDINDQGQVVGSTTTNSCESLAAIWQGSWQPIGKLTSTDTSSIAYGINAPGAKVVGTSFRSNGLRSPFIYDVGMGQMSALAYPLDEADAIDVNDAGEAVGIAYDNNVGAHLALRWDTSGAVFPLGYLPGHNISHAWSINQQGTIVGLSAGTTGSDAIIWDAVNGLQDLQGLLDASGAGWDLTEAKDINDQGWIVGTGVNPAGDTEAFILRPSQPAPEPGACCLDDGTCVQLMPEVCADKGGQYQGAGVPCTGDSCQTIDPEVGACCLDDGTCLQVNVQDCEAKHGMFMGPGTLCDEGICPIVDPTPAPEPGACCLDDGTCVQLLPEVCADKGGQFQGAGVPCTGDSCQTIDPEVGACCLDDGTCLQANVQDCEAKHGLFMGPGTLCEDGVCPIVDPTPFPETGACCYEDGSCTQTIVERCESTGGQFMGPGVPCEADVCVVVEPAVGACCLSDGTCQVVGEVECLVLDGTYNGDGTVCSDVDCSVGGGCNQRSTNPLSFAWLLLGLSAVGVRRLRLR